MYLTRNQAWWQHHRGFESHLLRQIPFKYAPSGAFFVSTHQFTRHQVQGLISLDATVGGLNQQSAISVLANNGYCDSKFEFMKSTTIAPHPLPTPRF